MTRALLTLAALLAGCPSSLRTHAGTADCCADDGDGGCEWRPLQYTTPRGLEAFADDDRACRRAGLEPYE